DYVWIVLAGAGIVLLADPGGGSVHALGIGLAAVAGVLWANNIVLGTKLGRAFEGGDGLALALIAGFLLSLPGGIASAGTRLLHPDLIGIGAGIGILAAAIPWS